MPAPGRPIDAARAEPMALADHHELADFDSGEPSLDDWLKRRAAKNQVNGSSRTYVVCEGNTVIGYSTLKSRSSTRHRRDQAAARGRIKPADGARVGQISRRRASDSSNHGPCRRRWQGQAQL